MLDQYKKVQKSDNKEHVGPNSGLKEGVQCMLVKFFARKAAWLTFTQIAPQQRFADPAAQ